MTGSRPHVDSAAGTRRAARELEDLREALLAFSRTARSLEGAYRHLEREKQRIDLRLEKKNRELEETVGHLDALLESMPAGVVATDPRGRVTRVNREAERILGIVSGDLLGRPASELTDASRHPLFTGERGELPRERRIRTARGEERVVAFDASDVVDRSGRILGILHTLIDRTEVRALEESLAQRNRMAEMGEMASVLAHQIRNPLNGIAGFGRLISERLDEGSSEGVDRYARCIVEASTRLDALVTGLLRLCRDEAPRRETVDLRAVVRESVDSLSRVVEGTLEVIVGRGPIPVDADATLLVEAARNLVTNALEAAGPRGRVRLQVLRRGDRAALRVHDDGPGMDAATAERVFHPFFTTKETGYGLGLPIARKAIERCDGTVTVRSRPGRGCRVRVDLRCARGEGHDAAR